MQFVLTAASQFLQFTAILGDLQHKHDLFVLSQSFDNSVSCHFSSCNQAGYVLEYTPWLVPSQPPLNNHSISTLFEAQYYSNLSFKFGYLSTFPHLLCYCS
jgi:hypothetical protein